MPDDSLQPLILGLGAIIPVVALVILGFYVANQDPNGPILTTVYQGNYTITLAYVGSCSSFLSSGPCENVQIAVPGGVLNWEFHCTLYHANMAVSAYETNDSSWHLQNVLGGC